MKERSAAYSGYFIVIVAVFVTCLITANIVAVKVAVIFGLVLPAAVVFFPLSYICGDVLTEVYGYRRARQVIWLGFGCNLIAVVAIFIGLALPAAPFWPGQAAYEQILGYTPRLLIASFVAYLAGEFANSFVLARMKVATKGRWLWTRTIGSTLVGQGLDSLVFIGIAFWGVVPALEVMIVSQWLTKCAIEIVATPITYAVIGFLKAREGVDTFDDETDFNPLRL